MAEVDGTNPEIYVMNADGTNPTRLPNNPVPDLQPAWSPDGRRIAFARCCYDYGWAVYVMNGMGRARHA